MKRILSAILIASSTAFFADAAGFITINAPSADGAEAVMFGSDGTVFATGVFSGGAASITVPDSVANGTAFHVSVKATADSTSYSDIYWDTGTANSQQMSWDGGSWTAEVLTGDITSRSYDAGTSTASFTLQSSANLSTYNDWGGDAWYQMDGNITLYRPTTDSDDLYNNVMTRYWDPNTLDTDFSYNVSVDKVVDEFYGIQITANDGSFVASYLGEDSPAGVGYDLAFSPFSDAGGSVYDAGGTIDTATTPEAVIFTADLGGTVSNGVPYYLVGDGWFYDDDFNTSAYADNGLDLTSPVHYVIPEPATVTLLALASGIALFWRRRFAA